VNKSLYRKEDISLHLRYVIETTYQYMSATKNSIQDLNKLRFVFEEECQKKLFDILSTYLIKSEYSSPLSSDLFIKFLKSNLRKTKNKIFKKEDLNNLISTITNDEIGDLVKQAVNLSGFRGKITAGISHNDSSFVELTRGFTFENLKTLFDLKNLDLRDVKIICVDGFVESVSEIHHLLEKISETKESVVFFARGFSNEVVHTLKVNFDRKTVIFIPVTVPYDLEGANILNDIAVISGSDVISSLKGQLINSANIDDYQRVDSVVFSGKDIVIINKNSSSRVDKHIRFLQNKIENSENDASSDILSKRIKRLGSIQANIFVSKSENSKSKLLSLDRCIRAIKSATTYGVVEIDNLMYPNSSVESAKFYLDKFTKSIEEIGCIVNTR